MTRQRERSTCGACRHFDGDPITFECRFPGILALSSGHGDARGDQGFCLHHDQMVARSYACPAFADQPQSGRSQ